MAYSNESKNVIVLEDDLSMVRTLNEMIEKIGFVPHSSRNREQFLGIYYSDISYFAIILDNQVPYDNQAEKRGMIKKDVGLNLAPELLRREKGLRVALHTGCDMSPKQDEFEKIGLVYLPKPVAMQSLRRFLEAA